MGEDFLRRKNAGFRRQRDLVFERLVAVDLYTSATPATERQVSGDLYGDASVNAGDLLWAPSGDGESVPLYLGSQHVVTVDRQAADLLRGNSPDGYVTARVTSVDHDVASVTLIGPGGRDER